MYKRNTAVELYNGHFTDCVNTGLYYACSKQFARTIRTGEKQGALSGQPRWRFDDDDDARTATWPFNGVSPRRPITAPSIRPFDYECRYNGDRSTMASTDVPTDANTVCIRHVCARIVCFRWWGHLNVDLSNGIH